MRKILIAFAIFISGCTQNPTYTGITATQIDSIKERIQTIGKRFNYKKNDFTGVYWYTPIMDTSTEESVKKSKLFIMVKQDGSYQLMSFYCGERFIFHDQVRCNVNDSVFETKHIDSLDRKLWKRQMLENLVAERMLFTDKNDNGLPMIISRAKGVVKVAYIGTHAETAQTVLTPKEVDDIKYAYELHNLITALNDTVILKKPLQ